MAASSAASSNASFNATDVTSIFMASDRHSTDEKLNSILAQIKDDKTIKAALLNGDYVNNTEEYTLAQITDAVRTGLGNTSMNVFYTFASHDENVTEDLNNFYFEGAIDLGACYLYGIDFDGMTVSEDAIEDSDAFTKWVNSLNDTKPIMVACHVPLHARRGDNVGAQYWVDDLNKAAETHDVIYTWGHNHTGESAKDTAVYYVEPGESIAVEDGTTKSSSSSSSKKKKSSSSSSSDSASSDASSDSSANATASIASKKKKKKSSTSVASEDADAENEYDTSGIVPTTINFTYVNTGYLKSGYGSVVSFGADEITIRRYSTKVLSDVKVIVKKHVTSGDASYKTIHTYKYKATTKATLKKAGVLTYYCTDGAKPTFTRPITKLKKAALSCTTYKYNGKAKKPKVTVTDADGDVIATTYYKVTYPKGRKKVGKYTVTVKFKGLYSGTKKLTFKIKKK